MASAVQKITLSSSCDILFNKLVLSQSNIRRVKAGVSIEELAEDIARRTLLQGLNVRPVLDAEGVETGMFEVPAGGRRYRALQLLVKQKRLAKTATPAPGNVGSKPSCKKARAASRRDCPQRLVVGDGLERDPGRLQDGPLCQHLRQRVHPVRVFKGCPDADIC
ncbi:ParB-like nuclease domain-containing protein [Mesorhizobium sp. NFR06]|nr:ParB-like nuclease domain-containing protein [Mesorhizobium sp. NFR06]